MDPRAHVLFCPNCHLALRPEPGRIRVTPQSHVVRGQVRLDGDYLPFWRYEFEAQVAGRTVGSLEDYARALFPQALPPRFRPTGPYLWIPAVRLLGTEAGDRETKDLVEWIHAQPPTVHEGKVPVGGRPVLWSATVSEEDARALAPFVLFGIHDETSAARLNTLLVKTAIQDAKLTLTNPRLVLLPMDRIGETLGIEGTKVGIPLLLLKGGPEAEALRVSVHSIRFDDSRPGPARPWRKPTP